MASKTGVVSLLLVLISSSLIALSNADVFSSSFKMESLVKTRQKVIEDLDAYINKEENRIRDLKRRLDQYRVEQQNSLENVESYVTHPVNAYILIKRLTLDLDHIKKLSKNIEFEPNLSEHNKNGTILYPKSVDLSGAAKALMRLRRMYKMTVEDMANGLIDGTIYHSDKRNVSVGSSMSASDCHQIGVIIFRTKNYLNSLPWHMEALKRLKSPYNEDDSITEIEIMEYIGITYYHLGDMKSAIDWTLKILAIDPDNIRAQNNIVFYEQIDFGLKDKHAPITSAEPDVSETNADNLSTRELPINNDITDNNEGNDRDFDDNDTHENSKDTTDYIDSPVVSEDHIMKSATHTESKKEDRYGTRTKSTKEDRTATYTDNTKEGRNAANTESITPMDLDDGLFRKVEFAKEMAMYEALCRGEFNVPPQMAPRLHCRYIHDAPFLKIAPIKAEHWYFEPDVMIFHDVITDTEIEHIKELGAKSLKRARVGSVEKNESVVADYRISQNTWLSDHDSPIIDHISARAEAFTGLSLKSSEDLQLANYGMAGHYEPHFDWTGRVVDDFKPIGWERIATLMFYLSDVAKGGATVFPKLGISVFPKKGSAIFWINLLASGEGNRATRHAACPVLEGSKWVANKWINMFDNEFIRPCGLEYESEDGPHTLHDPVPKPEVVNPLIVRYS